MAGMKDEGMERPSDAQCLQEMMDIYTKQLLAAYKARLKRSQANWVDKRTAICSSYGKKFHLPDTTKGLLVALFGGGVPAGFVAPFSRIANEMSNIPSLEILFIRCIFHLSFVFWMCFKQLPFFGPAEAWRRIFLQALINVISIGCAYSAFMVLPTANAATVRKGSSTICSTLMALCITSDKLTWYDWIGLLGSILGLAIIMVPNLLTMDEKMREYDILGYISASLGGLALALGLVIFRTFQHQSKLMTAIFTFGVVGSIFCAPAMCLLQEPIMPHDSLTWICIVSISILALVSFFCSSYAVTKTHPALVCSMLHSEVVVTMAIQYYVLKESLTPLDIVGAGVIIGSIAIITAQNISCDEDDDDEEA